MSEERVNASARVTVSLLVTLDQPWGPEFTIAKVKEQATSEAINKVHNALRDSIQSRKVSILSDPKVEVIIGKI
jgi:hypothetical protein